ncbi:S-adenosyl-L-homocysteine hydrolase [Erythrobacter sp. NAP1]|uniref:hypothetical protein n=1 Tax=Erythrobacter sp. NAP1 TaxID=237727 RepID=UPI0000686AF9|nr:hypothetical protein [Erythrobacter sp. NAP1]EAQ29941.1 S-adenosyl-L-homocysteine hydrolase [Erythrobacter sp. NAP1]
MKGIGGLAAMLLSMASAPTMAQSQTSEAHKLRSLDIMLMVSSLRCRTGRDDFRAEYERFASSHLATLNRAGATLQRSLGGSARSLDRMGVQIANRFGDGHPSMSCAQLAALTRSLGKHADARLLAAAADLALGDEFASPKPPITQEQAPSIRITYSMVGLMEAYPTLAIGEPAF